MHSFMQTQTGLKTLSMKEMKRERERWWQTVSLKENRAWTHFTVEWPQATPDLRFPTVCECVCMCVRVWNPLLFIISLSRVSCPPLHCSATFNLLLGGFHAHSGLSVCLSLLIYIWVCMSAGVNQTNKCHCVVMNGVSPQALKSLSKRNDKLLLPACFSAQGEKMSNKLSLTVSQQNNLTSTSNQSLGHWVRITKLVYERGKKA